MAPSSGLSTGHHHSDNGGRSSRGIMDVPNGPRAGPLVADVWYREGNEVGRIEGAPYTTGFTPGNAVTRSRKAAPRISKLRYWSKEAQAGDSSTTGSVRPEASASRAALATATSSVPDISCGTRSPRVA